MNTSDKWMSENAVAKYFGLSSGSHVREWGIAHLSVKTTGGRIVRRYKLSDVQRFERDHMKQKEAV